MYFPRITHELVYYVPIVIFNAAIFTFRSVLLSVMRHVGHLPSFVASLFAALLSSRNS